MSTGNDLVHSQEKSLEKPKESYEEKSLRLGIADRLIKDIYELNCLPESLVRKNVFKYYVRYIKPPQGENNGQETSREKQERIKRENSSVIKNIFKKNYH